MNLLNLEIVSQSNISLKRERERDEIESRKAHLKEFKDILKFDDKLEYSKKIIKDFFVSLDKYNLDKTKPIDVLIAFSGGKDSSVLFHLVVSTYDNLLKNNVLETKFFIIPGYAYEITFPETKKFIEDTVKNIRNQYPFVKELFFKKPKLPWQEILENHGYPIFSKQFSVMLNRIQKVKSKNGLTKWIFKIDTQRYGIGKNRLFLLDKEMRKFPTHSDKWDIDAEYFGPTIHKFNNFYSEKCCDYIKGGLKHLKIPSFVGTMASESKLREQSWIKYGCNIINKKKCISRPLSIWTEIDVWKYIVKNKVEINKMYGFNKEKFNNYKDNDEIRKLIKSLSYKRLGCTACPYGAHLEKDKNRFEILKEQSEMLYNSQVIKNGMYKNLIDMGIKISNDSKYMQLFNARWRDIDDWINQFPDKIFSVIAQIENYKNYKKYKNPKANWHYSSLEIKQILDNYKLCFDSNQIKHKIKYWRDYWKKNHFKFINNKEGK